MGSQIQTLTMHGLAQICVLSLAASSVIGLPQFVPVAEVRSSKGEVIQVDAGNLDINGCLVGPSGERVCPLGAFGSDGQSKVLFRGNKGPGQTGSNGNAGPLNAAGYAIDPAAELKKKQDIAYTLWAEQQIKNAERQLGTAGRK